MNQEIVRAEAEGQFYQEVELQSGVVVRAEFRDNEVRLSFSNNPAIQMTWKPTAGLRLYGMDLGESAHTEALADLAMDVWNSAMFGGEFAVDELDPCGDGGSGGNTFIDVTVNGDVNVLTGLG